MHLQLILKGTSYIFPVQYRTTVSSTDAVLEVVYPAIEKEVMELAVFKAMETKELFC